MSWTIDNTHSDVSFSVRHMMISKVKGHFDTFTGEVNFDADNPTNTTLNIQIDANSINTRDEKRDGHLRSADFFDVEKYPNLTFVSKRVEQNGTNEGSLVGDLTVHGVTKEVVLAVEYAGIAKSPWGTESAGFSATTTISRADFGLTWNQALETGGILVGDKIKIEIELEIIKQG